LPYSVVQTVGRGIIHHTNIVHPLGDIKILDERLEVEASGKDVASLDDLAELSLDLLATLRVPNLGLRFF
jgi:hypothetical protein